MVDIGFGLTREGIMAMPYAILEKTGRNHLFKNAMQHEDGMKALCWWRREDVWYPTTAQVARKHLSICGTSVPSKRLFSLSGHIARNQLLPENVNKLFFGKNMD